MPRYNPAEIEPKWQRIWEERRTFETPAMPTGPKLYVLDMFPYPSGSGLHVGHPEGYTATDIVCRFERMRGKSVLHPMGFDSFGLPAEEHAIKTNTPPRSNTEQNIATFTRQLKQLGFSYDWGRVLATTDVEYFRWTQWIFLVLFDTWFDPVQQKGRPISELPIPAEVRQGYGGFTGEDAVRKYQDDHRLAYQSDALVNWCPALGTVLANEEVIDGKSERGNHPVQRLPLRQWMLRITAYADRLERDLEGLDWSEGIKKLQKDWIGRSTGAEVDFYIGPREGFEPWKLTRRVTSYPARPGDDVLRIYTTRPDTLFGATYMVIAPEHPFALRLTTPDQRAAVEAYVQRAAGRSDRERQEEKKEKTGVFTGSYAMNPVNGAAVPIWIADYVLISYGTGAIMAVPAHDERDFAFARQFQIPIIAVVDPGDAKDVNRDQVLAGQECSTVDGVAINSGPYNGFATADFKSQISNHLTTANLGRAATNYKLRDWLFSRQRFWGEPFPILHELGPDGKPTGLLRAVKPEELPVDLPHLDDYKPIGRPEPPLGKAPAEWLYPIIDGKKYRRETNTMPQWAGSCWYFLRFIDPRNSQRFLSADMEKAWMPVDLYVGGAEHAVLHLLYSRFWHKVLYDRGHVSCPEPFQKLVNQGMILGEMEYRVSPEGHAAHRAEIERRGLKVVHIKDDDGEDIYILKQLVPPDGLMNLSDEQIEKRKGKVFLKGSEIELTGRSDKMSKSRGNVVNPEDVVEQYGADSLRLYEMFMGPLEATKPWSMQGVSGVRNFLDRVWRLIVDPAEDDVGHVSNAPLKLNAAIHAVPPTDEQNRILHKTIKAVTHDIEKLLVNTAIARMMEFVNFFTKETVRPRAALEQFVLLLSPYAPHIAEELWQLLGHNESLAYEPWPTYDESLTIDASVEIPVQIKGKLRAKIQVPAGLDAAALEAAARADAKVAEQLAGQQVVKVIAVPGKLVNFVTK